MKHKQLLEEYRQISHVLDQHHALFYKMWEYGVPEFTNDSNFPTAAMLFDPKSRMPFKFRFNEDFWQSIDLYTRSFVVAHECLHALLNHPVRSEHMDDGDGNINIAMDISVNHMLVNFFGFDRDKIMGAENYCWTDTVFPDKLISDQYTFEQYYAMLAEEGLSGTSGSVGTVDDHSGMNKTDVSDILDAMKNASYEEKSDFLDVANTVDPNSTGRRPLAPPAPVIKPSMAWTKLVKNWKRKALAPPDESEQWTSISRRFHLLPDDIVMPAYTEYGDPEFCLAKLKTWLFLDCSGSCNDLYTTFFLASDTIPKKRFKVELFAFSTQVVPLRDRESFVEQHLFGGTSFHAIDRYVQSRINSGDVPDIILVFTDGEAKHPTAYVMPEKWHWFISDAVADNALVSMRDVPKTSHAHLLEEFYNVSE